MHMHVAICVTSIVHYISPSSGVVFYILLMALEQVHYKRACKISGGTMSFSNMNTLQTSETKI